MNTTPTMIILRSKQKHSEEKSKGEKETSWEEISYRVEYYINGDGRREEMKRKKVTKAPAPACVYESLYANKIYHQQHSPMCVWWRKSDEENSEGAHTKYCVKEEDWTTEWCGMLLCTVESQRHTNSVVGGGGSMWEPSVRMAGADLYSRVQCRLQGNFIS